MISDTQPSARSSPKNADPEVFDTSDSRLLPILASTHFCMDVLLSGSVLDLGSAVEVLVFDPCALLRIFAQVAQECPELDGQSLRLEECIIALGASGLRHALRYAPSTWQQQARLSRFADHGVLIGRYCRTAAALVELCGEMAYQVGLLHAIGTLPAYLNHTSAVDGAVAAASAAAITGSYCLPPQLREAVQQVHEKDENSVWGRLVRDAHFDVTSLADSAACTWCA